MTRSQLVLAHHRRSYSQFARLQHQPASTNTSHEPPETGNTGGDEGTRGPGSLQGENLPVSRKSTVATIPQPLPQKDLLELVGPDDGESVEDHLEFFRDPYRRGYAPADGPQLSVSDSKEEWTYPRENEVTCANDYEQDTLRQLRAAVALRLRRPNDADLDDIYQLYRRLPEPRMPYLTGLLRHQLLRAFGKPNKKDAESMLRYFAVVADVKNGGLKLTRTEWNAAMSYAARYVGKSTHVEVESALVLWKEMEHIAGIRGNDVTFQVLFDVASKAGNFTLAEMLYREMDARGHVFNRYHHVSLIHFFGLKYDTAGVRAAYRDMVHKGEIIDTVVLNCVISGFLRCGEEDAAEQVYEKMKAHHSKTTELPARDYATNRMITNVFEMFTRVSRKHPKMQPTFQSLAPLTPDLQTYRLLVNHYSIKLGDISKVAQFLDEMKMFRIGLHGAIFVAIFKGFCTHGGFPGSAWSEQRLESVWTALLHALDTEAEGLHIRTWLAMWALRAFKKCTSEEKVLDVYEALRKRWDLDPTNTQFMVDFLHRLLARGRIRQGATEDTRLLEVNSPGEQSTE